MTGAQPFGVERAARRFARGIERLHVAGVYGRDAAADKPHDAEEASWFDRLPTVP